VTKSYEADEFPVPAIKFVLESTATEPLHIRLTDSIPETFPRENVGFHPDFEKDNWTAFKNHRVEYDRRLDPEETTTTVYGVRLEGADPATFLIEPELSFPDADGEGDTVSAVDDVLGEDSNQIVRDVLSGDRESLPGLDDEKADDDAAVDDAAADAPTEDLDLDLDLDEEAPEDEADETEGEIDETEGEIDETEDETDAPAPHAFDDAGDSATERVEDVAVSPVDTVDDESAGEESPADESVDDAPAEGGAVAGGVELDLDEDETEPDADDADDGSTTEPDADDADDGPATEPDAEALEAAADDVGADPVAVDGSVVGALADEIRHGDVDKEDVAALREALGAGGEPSEVPRSVDLRIGRLQSKVEDLAAYADGLEAFLDEEGTAEELIEGVRADVQATESEIDTLVARMDDADDDRGRLHADVTALRDDVSGVDDRVDDVAESVDDATERLADVTDRLDEMAGRFDDVDERLTAIDDRLDDVDARAARAEETAAGLDDEVDGLREDVAALDDDIAETRAELDDEITSVREAAEDDIAETREELDESVSAVRDDVAAIEDDLDRLDETVEDFRAFRDRLSSALGTMAGGAAAAGSDDDGDDGDDGDDHEASDDGDDGDDDES
jgi:predicted  nucleic acid-binding Zn-ribbon protein